ncbi:MAG: S41 family peptidase [Spirochaetaceae bacterium]|nr:S41 family peptidase [Spirochaetaceae bacterium]
MFSIKNKEKYLWMGASVFLAIVVVLFLLSPFTFAQTTGSNDASAYTDVLQQVMKFIQNYYVEDVDPKKLYEGAMKGMFESLGDPYSVFLTASDMDDLSDTTTGKFGGVGLYISKFSGDITYDEKHLPYVKVVAPIEGTPAYRLGISAGDYIIKIGDKSTEKMTLDEVLKQLRGEPGTKVNITILRGEDIVFAVDIQREYIVVPTVKSAMIDKNIAYLRIIQFTPITTTDVKNALDGFTKKGYKSLIIDLRGNPGGLLSSVTDIANFFLSNEVIVSTRSKIPSENQIYKAEKAVLVSKDIPIIVLIDKGSASASEILAGALKDNKRGFLIGEKTFGKGSVQQVRSIGDAGFKLTMSRYYTPSGENIDKVGIAPDKEIKEETFTDKETESYKKIIEQFIIQDFVKNKPNPTESDISSFINKIQNDGIVLKERVIRKLIRNELNKTNNDPPVYDLEYDLVLKGAVEIIKGK